MPVFVACVALLLGACTSDSGPSRADDSTTRPTDQADSPARLGRYELIGDCEGLAALRGSKDDVSFVAGGKVYVARHDGTTAGCVLEADAVDLEWGPEADRLHLGDLRRFGRTETSVLDDDVESVAWSRPTGKSVVYIAQGRLMKVDAFGQEPYEISFLEDHDEVVYHPAGTHIAVTGTDSEGVYGLWLATTPARTIK